MASRGVNKVILVGNIGQDPEVKFMPDGKQVTNISLATSEVWKDKNTQQEQSRTEWHKIVFFGRLAEIAGEYVRKGSKIYVEGSLRTRKWKDQGGQDRYTTEIVASEMQFLDPHNSNTSNASNNHSPASQSAPPARQQYAPPPQAGMDDFDDDIPF